MARDMQQRIRPLEFTLFVGLDVDKKRIAVTVRHGAVPLESCAIIPGVSDRRYIINAAAPLPRFAR